MEQPHTGGTPTPPIIRLTLEGRGPAGLIRDRADEPGDGVTQALGAPAVGDTAPVASAEPARRRLTALLRIYVAIAIVVFLVWIVLGVVVLSRTPYPSRGPGDLSHATAQVPADILRVGKSVEQSLHDPIKGALDNAAPGGPLWVLYSLKPDNSVYDAVAIDAQTQQHVTDASRLIPTGAWDDLGFVKKPEEWILGGVSVAAILAGAGVWGAGHAARGILARRDPRRNGLLRVISHPAVVCTLMVVFVGFIYVWFVPGWSRAMKVRAAFWGALGWCGFFLIFAITRAYSEGDAPSVTAATYLTVVGVGAWLYGWFVLRPAAAACVEALASVPQPVPPRRGWATGIAPAAGVPTALPRTTLGSLASPAAVGSASSGTPTAAISPASPDPSLRVLTPDHLSDFSSVGGMTALKAQIDATVGRLLAFPAEAEELEVNFGGLLLFGPPGTGKTFIVRAMAGEYGLNLIVVSSAELSGAVRGEEGKKIVACFQAAWKAAPCVLFFDEFDAIARRRDGGGTSSEDRTSLTILLQQLEQVRDRRDVIVAAATNDVNAIDPAAIRPGRFDRQIRVDLPDREGRGQILKAQLAERKRVDAGIDVDLLADRTVGMTPAALAAGVRRAAEVVLDDIARGNTERTITEVDLLTCLKGGAGTDRPTVERWTWGRLVLASRTKDELRQLQRLIESPEVATLLGLPPLTGALLFGPPGTGKTTIARVLATEAHCNFYPLKGSDLVSKWVGDTERNIAEAFNRARDNAPAIIFIDEIDAIAPHRGAGGSSLGDRAVNQILQEIDGIGSRPGVFVLGATNRMDVLDPALLRGGRLSRHIEIPLPDPAGRMDLLRLQTARMPLASEVDLSVLVTATDGRSGADLQALCQQAGIEALMRVSGVDASATKVNMTDFQAALGAQRGET